MDLLRELLEYLGDRANATDNEHKFQQGSNDKTRTKEFTDIVKWQAAARDMGCTTHQQGLDMVAMDRKGKKVGVWKKSDNKGTLSTLAESQVNESKMPPNDGTTIGIFKATSYSDAPKDVVDGLKTVRGSHLGDSGLYTVKPKGLVDEQYWYLGDGDSFWWNGVKFLDEETSKIANALHLLYMATVEDAAPKEHNLPLEYDSDGWDKVFTEDEFDSVQTEKGCARYIKAKLIHEKAAE